MRTAMLKLIFSTAALFTIVAAQAPKPFGHGWGFIKPLPPAKNPNAPGVAEECTTVAIRTLSGRCTSAADPALGEARRAQFSYFDVNTVNPIGEDLPSPRLISNIVSAQNGNSFNSLGLNEMLTFFGQFIDHDFALSPFSDPEEELEIEVPTNDPSLSKSTLEFVRSQRAPVNDSTTVERPITVLSSALDLSSVYGVDEIRNSFLRVPNSCRLKTSRGNLLPFNTGGLVNSPSTSADLFIAGDTRANETPMLTAIHTIWLREHNRICRRLENTFPIFSAEKLYETARAINIAQYQKIVYEEWLPALLGSRLPSYTGYQKNVNPTVSLEFTTAGFRLGHTLVGEDVTRINEYGKKLPPIPAEDMFFAPSSSISPRRIEEFLRGASYTKAQEFDEKVVNILRDFLFENVEEEEGFDLIALNLQRGRDHGVVKFNDLREFFLGSRARSFKEISSDPTTANNLQEAYGNVDNVEAWIGLMAEDKNPGAGVGRTLEALLKTEFTRLRDGDQFFYLLKNQIPFIVLEKLPGIKRGIFSSSPLFNRILVRNTRIPAKFLPRSRNAFVA
ncbi:Peroxinectin A [Gracilariopsis chorda]|uniref:Peroxinectin A n=1 Tax=Gracilariopsis chorda TaxID=448386 RepID=A0A2V3IN72_9FLOR|nr:Peroxinectin A [Gracilariopsis chorda]PXF43535.1 Peroxinectin A [Gracilariopsis chorda]|eukprot:PXF43534.1 Peroxinectin A [Gracilariopsis chorda]